MPGSRVSREFDAPFTPSANYGRREAVKLMSASLMLMGLGGCGRGESDEHAVPYVDMPEGAVPGVPRAYATAVPLSGYAQPVVGTTIDGRPIRLDGNATHPASNGGIDALTQAAVLQLYDPDRSQAILNLGRESSDAQFQAALHDAMRGHAGPTGRGLRLLTGATTSPTLARQWALLRDRFPEARWHLHEPAVPLLDTAVAQAAFGTPAELIHHLDRAHAVVCIEADPLGPGPSQVYCAAAWAALRRQLRTGRSSPTLVVAERTPSLTGAQAEHRLVASSADVPALLHDLARRLGLGGAAQTASLSPAATAWADAAFRVLSDAGPSGLLMVGPQLPADLQAVGLAINAQIGSLGHTVVAAEPIDLRPRADGNLEKLVEAALGGEVGLLVMLDCNPVYSGPADLPVPDALSRIPFRVHAGLHADETAAQSHWHLPLAHPLESWSDGRAVDGSAVVIQPLIRPLHGGRTMHEVIALLTEETGAPRDLVRTTWMERLSNDEARWRQVLQDGCVPGTAAPTIAFQMAKLQALPASFAGAPAVRTEAGFTALFRPDSTLWDGRFANVTWLQELPKPLTTLTWDNIIAIAPATAKRLGLARGQIIRLEGENRTLEGPIWPLAGQCADVLTLFFGYGRTRGGAVGSDIGYSAFALQPRGGQWERQGIRLSALDRQASLAPMQLSDRTEDSDILRTVTPERPEVENRAAKASFYSDWSYPHDAWAMVIDSDLCIGCRACMTACQAENNIPVVGKEMVALGRIMHWLRVDRYYEGGDDNPVTHFQPVPCMHCEKAPCEVGCPVNATVHDPDGLNAMIYNRCVGTRTCSSYCPYKVRRFNYFTYTVDRESPLAAQYNPNVTVRERGVMEKCTYCVQRITAARIASEKAGRPIADGEVVTACQAACPTQAIIFGNLKDADSAVSRAKRDERNYTLLADLDTRPRTTYLARIRSSKPPQS
jgi:molybdopterin-containing oxidoreductase family iron-sulfur binding subunit